MEGVKTFAPRLVVYLSSIYPPSHRAALYPAAIPAAGAKNKPHPGPTPVRLSKGMTPNVTTTVTTEDSLISVAKDSFGDVIVLDPP